MTEPVNFCPGCGEKRRKGAAFCAECGTSFEERASAEAAVTQATVPQAAAPQAAAHQGQAPLAKSPPRTGAGIWFFIGCLSLALTQLPKATDMDMMNGGYALIVFAGFLTFVSFLAALVCHSRSRS
ncbi:MAG: hypothetical protein RDV48_20365 [Candidatus Eremiobacteraeota bacterium]|nr:hypothetical protein [Candidatus Eremiobacteraeota bacterium]